MTGQLIIDVVLAVVLVAFTAGAFLLAREIGRLQVRLGPLGARVMAGGPGPGDLGPAFEGLADVMDREVRIGGRRERHQLLVFVSPSCSTCRALLPGLKALARRERREYEVVLVSDGPLREHLEFLDGFTLGPDLSYVNAFAAGVAYQVAATPYAVALDRDGVVRAKGLCNHMQQVESLLNALEHGVPSLQHLHARAVSGQRG
ncbi:hypothetical protein [Streptomyces sp. NPDC047043]|uniref:hypothetical protein n=1 Tax=Streptomyces sp. NPDC047043 TaxID=3154497 RepID=UPI0033EF8CBF